MTPRNSLSLVGSLLLGLIVLIGIGSAQSLAVVGPAVHDDARLFKPATIDQVDVVVKEIHDKFDKDLTIRTFVAIPESLQPSFSAEDKESFYEHWLRHEARAAETNGIFILIVKKPGRLQIGVGNQTYTKAFTYADRDELRDLMLKSFREKKFDDGLVTAAHFVLERMEKNRAEPATAPPKATTLPSVVVPQTQPAGTTPAADAPTTKSMRRDQKLSPPPDSIELNK